MADRKQQEEREKIGGIAPQKDWARQIPAEDETAGSKPGSSTEGTRDEGGGVPRVKPGG
jgi:hypothetical protein